MADFGNIFERKEEGKNRLFKYLLMAQAQTKKNEAQAQKLAADIAGIRQAQLEEERLISAALIADEEAELRKVRALVDSLSEGYEQAEKSFDKKKEELELSYAAEDYADYVRQERSLAELKQYMTTAAGEERTLQRSLKVWQRRSTHIWRRSFPQPGTASVKQRQNCRRARRRLTISERITA